MVLQFRSVRMLIAQDQLEQVSRQVRAPSSRWWSPIRGGRILLTNEAFDSLLPIGHAHVEWAEDLARVLQRTPPMCAAACSETAQQRRSWRGEVGLIAGSGGQAAFMVRADPCSPHPIASWASSCCSSI